MAWAEPKTEAERAALEKNGWKGVRFNVCWRCGSGPHTRKTLYRVGKAKDQTMYACEDHRGLMGQVA